MLATKNWWKVFYDGVGGVLMGELVCRWIRWNWFAREEDSTWEEEDDEDEV